MSESVKTLPKLPPLPGDVEALLARERPAVDRMPEASRGRVWAKVQAGTALRHTGGGRVRHGLGRTLLTFAAGAAVGSGAMLALRHPERASQLPAAVAERVPAPGPVPIETVPLERPPPPVPAVPRPKHHPVKAAAVIPPAPPPAPKPEPLSGDASLAAERLLVDTARTALTRAEPARALEALDAHARQFPDGTLAEEREALRVQAFLAQGDADAAGAAVARFARKYPKSLLLPALRASLAAGAGDSP